MKEAPQCRNLKSERNTTGFRPWFDILIQLQPKRLKRRDECIIVYWYPPPPTRRIVIFWPFLAISLTTTFTSFTKLRFRPSFGGAEIWHKMQMGRLLVDNDCLISSLEALWLQHIVAVRRLGQCFECLGYITLNRTSTFKSSYHTSV